MRSSSAVFERTASAAQRPGLSGARSFISLSGVTRSSVFSWRWQCRTWDRRQKNVRTIPIQRQRRAYQDIDVHHDPRLARHTGNTRPKCARLFDGLHVFGTIFKKGEHLLNSIYGLSPTLVLHALSRETPCIPSSQVRTPWPPNAPLRESCLQACSGARMLQRM